MADTDRTIDALKQIAKFKGKEADAPAERLALYAESLEPFPQPMVDAALRAIMFDADPWFPPFGKIMEHIAGSLEGDRVMPPDDAWRLAWRATGRYQPQTRPAVASGNPAVDAAIRAVGGPDAFQCADEKGREILRGKFLAAYKAHAATPDHVVWALASGPREPLLVPGLELPDREIGALLDEATARGVEVPAPLLGALTGTPQRATIADGRARRDPLALPAPDPEPLTPERRAALNAEAKAGIARLAEGMRLPHVDRHTDEEAMIRRFAEAGVRVVRAADGTLAVSKLAQVETEVTGK